MMKGKFLWLAVLLMPLQSIASGYTIGNNWRWSKDVGALDVRAEADWLRPVNTTPVISMPQALRLRMLTFTTDSYGLSSVDKLVLEYRTEPQPNSATAIDSKGVKVNATSPTAGEWIQVLAEDPTSSSSAFVMDPKYDDTVPGALKDKTVGQTPSFNLLYNNSSVSGGSTGPLAFARHQDITSGSHATRRGAIGLSKTPELTTAQVSGINNIQSGGVETEYRLVVTKNAEAGKTYYFRMRNTGGTAIGTIDHWDYAAGYPSIAISADFNGKVNKQLPDLNAMFTGGGGTYETGISRSGSLIISNLSQIPTSGPINVEIVIPLGWAFDFTALPNNWSYSASSGILSSTTAVIAPGGYSKFTFDVVNTNDGFAASQLFASISDPETDGNGANNSATLLIYKQK